MPELSERKSRSPQVLSRLPFVVFLAVGGLAGGTIVQTAEANAFYYTYSTIAQTLAGAFGFLVAVCFYRLQSIGYGLREMASLLRNNFKGGDRDYTHLMYRGAYGEFISVAEKAGLATESRDVIEMFQQFKCDFGTGRRIMQAFHRSVTPTAVTIGACICLLPIVEQLRRIGYHGAPLGIVAAGALYCIVEYVILVKVTVE